MANFKGILITGSSVDGKTAPCRGCSSKLFGKHLTKKMVDVIYEWRSKTDAVLVGRKTVLIDDPSLYCLGNENYTRIVIDQNLTLPLNRKFFDGSMRSIVVTTVLGKERKKNTLRSKGVEIFQVKKTTFFDDLKKELMKVCISKVLVESGGTIGAHVLRHGFCTEFVVGYFPFLIGGARTPTVLDDYVHNSHKAIKLKLLTIETVDNDMLLARYKIM